MRKQNIAAALLLFCFLLISSSVLAQPGSEITRTALSKMSVLSRAEFFEKEIADAARREGVDPKILWTIAYNETRFRPWLTSRKNAQGLMQFIPATAERFGLADPYEPNAAIYAAARYVKYLGKLFDWRLDSILAAYNSGEGTVSAYLNGKSIRSNGRLINPSGRRTTGGVPPYRETVNYVSEGLKVYRWLESQGRFRGASKEVHIYATSQTNPYERAVPEEKAPKKKASTIVLYDPRTGRRFAVDGSGSRNLNTINEDGPVIVSPDLRGLPVQKARSTFAGVTKPQK